MDQKIYEQRKIMLRLKTVKNKTEGNQNLPVLIKWSRNYSLKYNILNFCLNSNYLRNPDSKKDVGLDS